MKKIHKILIAASISLVITLLIILIAGVYSRRGSEKAAGIYFASGGGSYISISPASLNRLRVDSCFFHSASPAYNWRKPDKQKTKAAFHQDKLIITREKKDRYCQKLKLILVLKPSETIKGDWDLVDAEFKIFEGGSSYLLTEDFRKKIRDAFLLWDYDKFKRPLNLVFHPGIDQYVSLGKKQKPVKSFLHRIDEPELPNYFQQIINGKSAPSSMLKFARRLMKRRPNDAWCALHQIEMESRYGDPEKALNLIAEWEEKIRESENVLMKENLHKVRNNTYHSITFSRHPGLKKIWDSLFLSGSTYFPEYSLPDRLEWIKEFSKIDYLLKRNNPLMSQYNIFAHLWRASSLYSHDLEVTANCIRHLSLLYFFQDRLKESLDILAGCYRLGQILNNTIEFSHAGSSLRKYAITGFYFYGMKACKTVKDMNKLCQVLERLHSISQQRETWERLIRERKSPLINYLESKTPVSTSRFSREMRKQKEFDAYFQVLRASCAARMFFLEKGRFPDAEETFDAILPGGLPTDPFAENDKLKILHSDNDDLTIYSIGPNEKDDHAGELENGDDIYLCIPEKSEFPLPEKPVSASNAEQLLEQFPNGLPPDLFADTENRPLSILDSTEKEPVRIFSFGPDQDEQEYMDNMTIKQTASSATMQLVFSPDPVSHNKENDLHDHFKADPMYDPTNGIDSNGDLFITLPRRGQTLP